MKEYSTRNKLVHKDFVPAMITGHPTESTTRMGNYRRHGTRGLPGLRRVMTFFSSGALLSLGHLNGLAVSVDVS